MNSFQPRGERRRFSPSRNDQPSNNQRAPFQNARPRQGQAGSNPEPRRFDSNQRPAQNDRPRQDRSNSEPRRFDSNQRPADRSRPALPTERRDWNTDRPQRGQERSPQRPAQQRPAQQQAAFAPNVPPPAPRAPLTPERQAAIEASPFRALGITPEVVRALLDENYDAPTPVQSKVIPDAAAGRDVLACAQTGTGKTAAFVLPILHQLAADTTPHEGIQALVLTPTRELAAQIGERITAYGRYLRVRHTIVYGGVSQHRQERALDDRPRILVATPGRLLDLMQQGLVRLNHVRHFVLDEADRMLDMGFIHDVRRIMAAVPSEKQTLLFSATVPRPIESLAQGLLRNPVRIDITPAVKSAETVEQSVVFVPKDQKSALLERLLQKPDIERAIVFTRTKHGANRLSQRLEKIGIGAPAIHGNKSQNARERALDGFRGGKTRILVATDIAARGIDVDGISHVINFDLPNEPESYVHRIGRTGRAGASGQAISFCDRDERPLLQDIERLLKKRISVVDAGGI